MYLKDLTELNGVSGDEDEVREYIKKIAMNYSNDITEDSMGNLIVFKKGTTSSKKIMLSAHMDEVGLIVSGFGDKGSIKFKTVGGIDYRILPGKRVKIGKKNIDGIIGCKAIHMQKESERTKNFPEESLFIDVGFDKKEEVEKIIKLGDYIAFDSKYVEFGDRLIKAKALDDRVGCSILLEILKNTYRFDLYLCFTVQEEVGLRGSEITAYTVNPDIAFVIEGTTCSDVPEIEKHSYSTRLGKGPAITIMDRTAIANKDLIDFIVTVAKKNNHIYQFKETVSGGNDAGKIQRTRQGVKTAAISVPCRYIHSPASAIHKDDYHVTLSLVKDVLKELEK